jgi:cystathionine beta-lyase/cystathionine gamma-synthase
MDKDKLYDALIHNGENRDLYYKAIAPPIIQTSNFAFDSIDHLQASIQDELHSHIYTRGNNPTTEILRKKLAALEHTQDALVTGSGVAAISIAVIANVNQGDHIISIAHPYSWTHKLLTSFLPRFGVDCTFVDGRDINNIEKAITDRTKLLYLESPNSATFELQDLAACASLAKKHNIVTVIDNSYASPIYQNPADYGIDLIVHSGTKYLNGHSDVVFGAICGSAEMIEKIFKNEFMTLGTILSPHDAFLVIRGLRTLEIRMKSIKEVTIKLVNYLTDHPKIKEVIYPGHESFPQHELAMKQMKGGTGLFSIILNVDSKEKVRTFVHALKKFIIAVSWGGHESLCMPFIAFHDMEGKEDHHVDWRLVRLSVGFEPYSYLQQDLEQALALI